MTTGDCGSSSAAPAVVLLPLTSSKWSSFWSSSAYVEVEVEVGWARDHWVSLLEGVGARSIKEQVGARPRVNLERFGMIGASIWCIGAGWDVFW